nr:MAG TPA: hypothetical protein [Caudoviricetes sp.]
MQNLCRHTFVRNFKEFTDFTRKKYNNLNPVEWRETFQESRTKSSLCF